MFFCKKIIEKNLEKYHSFVNLMLNKKINPILAIYDQKRRYFNIF